MTSPVNTEVKWARSSMPGAPSLTRAAGSLISLLDSLLVDGWGSQTATSVVVAGGIATATFSTDHAAALHAVVLVSGVTGGMVALNGEQKITSVESNKVRWATAVADGTATGTITVKMAAAGWAKPFTETNLAVYKSAHPAAHGQFLRINDTAAGNARAVGYENMTAISTGTGLFPSSAQFSGGYYWGKSQEPTGTNPVPWLFGSDERTFYLLVQPSYVYYSGAAPNSTVQAFGDMVPESAAGDAFATLISGAVVGDWTNNGGVFVLNYESGVDSMVATPRIFTGTGTSNRGMAKCEWRSPATSLPNPITGAISAGRVTYHDSAYSFARAVLPGVYVCPLSGGEKVVAPHEIISMEGGKTAAAFYIGYNSSDPNPANLGLLDVIGPWR